MRCLLPVFVLACGKEPDLDGDGWPAEKDCDDHDALVHPHAVEQCDDLDNDCDDEVDEGLGRTLWTDADGDGYGTTTSVNACRTTPGLAEEQGDCDDSDPGVHPGAKDPSCNGVDEDCDGNNPGESTWYADADGDGYGAPDSTTSACDPPTGFVDDDTDCNDGAPDIHPGVVDECGNEIDEDCVGGDAMCGFEGEIDLVDADAILTSEVANSDAGRLVEVGDTNGDGFDDVVVAAMFLNGGFLVPGPVLGTTTFESAGHTLVGDLVQGAGRSIGVGDVDGDGLDDVAFGAPYGPSLGQYIVYGPVTGDVDLDEQSDVELYGFYGNFLGHGSDLGDVDGDGIADGVVAAWGDKGWAGIMYVQLGPLTANVDIENDADVRIVGTADESMTGRMVHAGVDVDGDGIGDIGVNSIANSAGGPLAGGVYVVPGPPSSAGFDDAVLLIGAAPNGQAGNGFALGDFDGDGFGDVVANAFAPVPGGAAYVVHGPIPDDMSLADADVILEAEGPTDSLGMGLGRGDLDHDGVDELLVGSPGHGGAETGATFLVANPPTGTSLVSDVAQCVFVGGSSADASGTGVAAGDLDGAELLEVLIGAPGLEDGGGLAVLYATL